MVKTIKVPADSSKNIGIIIGGNPAKYNCQTRDFINKRSNNFLKLHGKSLSERKLVILQNKEKWIEK